MVFPGNCSHTIARGLVVAAPRSGSGKTLLSLGLMRALRNAGVRVAGAKCGPDYIDPAFHTAATGQQSLNLDSWAMDPALLVSLATATAASADLVLCEGSMGLFDGVPGDPGRTGTTADIAKALGWPVLLVLDVSGQAQTAAAIVKGCATLDPALDICGVVLNRVASERHRNLVTRAIESLGIELLGSLPRTETILLPERHLGLVQACETPVLDELLDRAAAFVAAHVDVSRIVASARALPIRGSNSAPAVRPPAQRIAIARDEAFSFLYPHLLSGWRRAGAEMAFFSPLSDEPPPADCDLCWLPGGYPELHAGKLAGARTFLDGLRAFAQTRPVHGECGGYMALGRSLVDKEGHAHAMAGLLDVSFSFAKRSLRLGYRDAYLAADHPLGDAGTRLRGHEFHYATCDETTDRDPPFAFVRDPYSDVREPTGSRQGRVTGSFFHVIAASEPSRESVELGTSC